jgi:hypothetical protein
MSSEKLEAVLSQRFVPYIYDGMKGNGLFGISSSVRHGKSFLSAYRLPQMMWTHLMRQCILLLFARS